MSALVEVIKKKYFVDRSTGVCRQVKPNKNRSKFTGYYSTSI